MCCPTCAPIFRPSSAGCAASSACRPRPDGAAAALPDDLELRADLTGVEYGYTGQGEIQLEKKEDMKKRGLASPDIGDALALTFAHPVRPDWLLDAPPRVRILDEGHDYDMFHDL